MCLLLNITAGSFVGSLFSKKIQRPLPQVFRLSRVSIFLFFFVTAGVQSPSRAGHDIFLVVCLVRQSDDESRYLFSLRENQLQSRRILVYLFFFGGLSPKRGRPCASRLLVWYHVMCLRILNPFQSNSSIACAKTRSSYNLLCGSSRASCLAPERSALSIKSVKICFPRGDCRCVCSTLRPPCLASWWGFLPLFQLELYVALPAPMSLVGKRTFYSATAAAAATAAFFCCRG